MNPNHIQISKTMDASDLGQLKLPNAAKQLNNTTILSLCYIGAVQCLPQLRDTHNFLSSRGLLSVRCRVHMRRYSDHIRVFDLYLLPS